MFALGSLKSLFPFIRPYRKWLIFSLLMAIPLSVLRVGPVPIVKYLVDDVLVRRDERGLMLIPLGVVALYALNFVFRFLHYYAIRIVVVNANQKVREKLFKHLLDLSMDHFSNRKAGEFLSRMTVDPHTLDQGIASFNVMIREPITFIALLGYTFYTNWKLALLTFTIVPGIAFVFARTGRFLKHRITSHQEQNSLTHSTLQESVAGVRVIHQFNLQEKMFSIFQKQQSEVSRLLLKISKIEEASSPMVEFVISFAIALMLYFGGRAVLDQEMTSGELIAFFTAFAMMINPIRQFSDINGKLHAASAAMDRIQNFLSWETRIKDAPQAAPFSRIQQGIRVQSISFHYPDTPERKVLDQVSFEIPLGKTIALVGHSGSGKSSLVQLMTRLFDVNLGEILIDGQDLRSIKIQDWRNHLAVVSQDVFLFHDTIYENIRIGNPSATRAEVIQAAQHAFAHDFIQSLPNQYETMVGDRGAKLSGGERQRISIARAFLRQADLLILDEATSNLDNQSEKLVQDTLDTLMKNKTTLVIAHRLSTIQNADEIIVLKEGRRVESGRYDELLAKKGEFYNLAINQ